MPASVYTRRQAAGAGMAAAIVAMAGTTSARAQDDREEYESPEYGMVVSWEAPWEKESVSEKSSVGFETIRLELIDGIDYISFTTTDISFDFETPGAYLDHFEASLLPEKIEPLRDATDGVHYLVQERTDTSVTVFLYFETSYGSTFELYEFHADEDADFATAVRMISRGEIFEGNIRSAQKVITLNGEAPYATFETADLVDLANGALEGRVPAEDDDEQATYDEDEAEDAAAAVTEALEKIRTHADALVGSIGDFTDLLAIESLSQEEADLANEIIALWQAAPAEAASVDLPSAYRKIERTYADLADALDQAATSIIALLEGTGDEPEHVDLVTMSFAAAEEAGSELDELLTDVGV